MKATLQYPIDLEKARALLETLFGRKPEVVAQNMAFLETVNYSYEMGRQGIGEYPITKQSLQQVGRLMGKTLPASQLQDELLALCNEAYKQGLKDARRQ